MIIQKRVLDTGDYCIVDIETTGFSRQNDSIIELSAIRYRSFIEEEAFSVLVKPEKPIPAVVQELTGITNTDVANAISPVVALRNFKKFIGNDIVGGWNIRSFDSTFLDTKYGYYLFEYFKNEIFDVMEVAKHFLPNLKAYKQVNVANYFGVDTSGSHRAINDCRICNAIFLNLFDYLSED